MQHYRYWSQHTSPGSSHNMRLWKALGSFIEARNNFLKFYNFETYLKIPRFARFTITKNCIQQLQPHRVFSTWLCMQRQDKELGTQMWMSTQSWYCHDLSKTIQKNIKKIQKSKKYQKKIKKISKNPKILIIPKLEIFANFRFHPAATRVSVFKDIKGETSPGPIRWESFLWSNFETLFFGQTCRNFFFGQPLRNF